MAELQNPDPLVEAVAKARAEASRRPDLKFPLGGLNQINGHVYAYSGVRAVDDTETDMLRFTTNTEALKVQIQFNYPTSDGDDFLYKVYFNGLVVQSYQIDHSKLYGYQNSVIYLIIPPNTEVKLTADNIGSSSARSQCASITGRVY